MRETRRKFLWMAAGIIILPAGCSTGRSRDIDTAVATKPQSSDVFRQWSQAVFTPGSTEAISNNIYGPLEIAESEDVVLDLPVYAESSEMVPITIVSGIPYVESIAVVVKENKIPLVGVYDFSRRAMAYVSTRIRIEKTSDVIVLAKAENRILMTKADVIVSSKNGCF